MAANTVPIFSKAGLYGSVNITAANTKSDGTATAIGTDIFLAFTADATNGSFVERVRFNPVATVAATSTNATTVRVFISTKSSGATTGGTDTFLYQELAIPSLTADATTTANIAFEVPMGFIVPAGYTILVSSHQTLATNTAIQATVIAGQY
jgi:hypothetical protein